ncbi:MAG: Ig-like domain-containing protein, partial [Chloroflexi bacterium]|nr:Ig-like domain-containing protein [Chloroflexota bacterium]
MQDIPTSGARRRSAPGNADRTLRRLARSGWAPRALRLLMALAITVLSLPPVPAGAAPAPLPDHTESTVAPAAPAAPTDLFVPLADTPTITINLLPAIVNVGVGQTTTMLTVQIQSDSNPIDAVEVNYKFDPAKVEVVDADTITPGVQVTLNVGSQPPFPFQQTLLNSVDNGTGTIKISAGRSAGATAPSGTFTLATFQLRGKAVGDAAIGLGLAEAAFNAATYRVVTTLPQITVIPSVLSKVSGDSQLGAVTSALANDFRVKLANPDNSAAANATVTWTITEQPAAAGADIDQVTTGAQTAVQSLTGSDGVASARLKLGGAMGTAAYTVTAAVAGASGSPVIFTASATAGPAAGIVKSAGDGQTAKVGTAAPNPLEVTVKDAGGNPVANTQVAFALGAIPGSATGQSVAPTSIATNADGKAQTSLTLGSKTGAYNVTATVAGLSVQTFTATATPGDTTKLAFTQQPSNGAAASPLAPLPVVQVQDTFGNLVNTATNTVTLSITTPGDPAASLSNCAGASVAAVAGVATFSGCQITLARTDYRLTAMAGGLTSATSASFTITSGPALTIARVDSTNNQSAVVATAPANPLAVLVTDALGNPVQGVTVSFAVETATLPVGATGQSIAFSASTNAQGIATAEFTLGNKVGTYTVKATGKKADTVTDLTGAPITFTAMATHGPMAQLAFTTQPSGAIASTAWTQQPAVTAQDAQGNTVTTGAVSVALTIATGTAGAALTCGGAGGAVGTTAGVASYTGCQIDLKGEYVLRASASGFQTNSASFSVATGPPAKLK